MRRNPDATAGERRWTAGASVVGVLAQVAERSPSRGGGDGVARGAGAAGAYQDGLLTERDLKAIERDYPDGVTSVQVVDIFTQRGLRFSEATFRKYVQLGLVPRSRRVGRKGKHQGSLGLYPPTTVRRINAIKQLMQENYTIDEIQKKYLRFRDEIETIERGLGAVLAAFEEELTAPRHDAPARRALKREVEEARRAGDDVVRRLTSIERRIAGPRDRPGGAGAPKGAEDLL